MTKSGGKSRNKDRDRDKAGSEAPIRGHYERSTPLGRVARNFEKAAKAASVALARLSSWESSGEPRVLTALNAARSAVDGAVLAGSTINALDKSGWKPPKKSFTIVFEKGMAVRIAEKYQPKYLEAFPRSVISNLTVTEILSSGEIAVRSGDLSPFLVAKSHIERRRTGKVASNGIKKPARSSSKSARDIAAR